MSRAHLNLANAELGAESNAYLGIDRIASFLGSALVLIAGAALLSGVQTQSSTHWHTVLETQAMLLAFFIGAIALLRFYVRKSNLFLFVGTAFIGTGLFDGYHAVVTSSYFVQYFPSASASLIAWSWLASRIYLSLLLLLGWIAWQREERRGDGGYVSERRIYAGITALTLCCFLFFALVPLPQAYRDDSSIHRIWDFLPALLFALTLWKYVGKGAWRTNNFEYWLVLSLIVATLSQLLYMPFSVRTFDSYFDAAHILKIISYSLVLVGLLNDAFRLFEQADEQMVKMHGENVQLAREVRAREKVEVNLKALNETLEERVAARTDDLEQARLAAFNMMEDAERARALAEGSREQLRSTLNREEALGRIRDCVLAVTDFARLSTVLNEHWIEELRALGVAVKQVSIQLYADDPGYYISYRALERGGDRHGTVCLDDVPWVREAWERDESVVVDRVGLDASGVAFACEIQSLLEVPLAKLGSLGLNSTQSGAFDEGAVRVVESFVGMLSTTIHRIAAHEALRSSETRFRQIFASAPVAIWEQNFAGAKEHLQQVGEIGDPEAYLSAHPFILQAAVDAIQTTDVNRRALELFAAADRNELLVSMVDILLPETRQFYMQGLKEMATGARFFKGETELQTLKGDRLHALVTISFPELNDPSEQALVCLMDISALKKAEVELYNNQRELEQQNSELRDMQRATLSIMEDSDEARKRAEEAVSEVRHYRDHLEELVEERTDALRAVNHELEAFSYSVSHDLRSPLRSIDGFSQALAEDYEEQLDEQGKDYLGRVRAASQRMAQLIDDMLNLSRLTRGELTKVQVDLSAMAREVEQELRAGNPGRGVEFVVEQSVIVEADPRMLRTVLDNLLGNAWKFTANKERARIEFAALDIDGERAYCVRDNGAGFDMQYVDKLFGAFQRLHANEEFSGSGVGLATVQRIVHRHGGRAWAEGEVGVGATMYFTL